MPRGGKQRRNRFSILHGNGPARAAPGPFPEKGLDQKGQRGDTPLCIPPGAAETVWVTVTPCPQVFPYSLLCVPPLFAHTALL